MVMIHHLVAVVAQSVLCTHDPDPINFLRFEGHESRPSIIKMRDISIGYSVNDRNQRLVVTCHEQPEAMIEAPSTIPNGISLRTMG